MLVRDLIPADLDRVLDINNAAVPAVGLLDRPGLDHLVEQSIVALAADVEAGDGDRGVVGFCLVLGPDARYDSVNFRWFAERYDSFVYLDRVAVDPAWHGRGIGRTFYERVAEQVAAAGGAEELCLEVNLRPRNDPSLAFHARLGFTEVGQQETPYGALVSLQTRPLTPRTVRGNRPE